MRALLAVVLAGMLVTCTKTGHAQEPGSQERPKVGEMIAYELTIVNLELGSDEEVDKATEVELAKHLTNWEEQQRIRWQKSMRLSALNQQAAYVKLSERKAIVTGTQESEAGRRTRNMTFEEVGLMFGVTGAAEVGGTVVAEVDVQHPYFPTDAALATGDTNEASAKGVEQNQVQTTVRCHVGKARLIGEVQTDAVDKSKTLVFLTAEVIE